MTEPDKNSIDQIFSSLPRKQFSPGRKPEVWLKIQNYLYSQQIARIKREQIRAEHKVWGVLLPWRRFAQIAITAISVIIAVSLMRGAALATPGQTLYPVKIAAEKVEKVLAGSEEAKVKVGIKHAKRRLAEVQILVAEENQNQAVVTQTLQALNNATSEVHEVVAASAVQKPELVSEAVKLASEEKAILGSVEDKVSTEVKAEVQKVIAATEESLNKLTSDDEVKGTTSATAASPEAATQATTTQDTTAITITKPTSRIPETILAAPIQINAIIEISPSGDPAPTQK